MIKHISFVITMLAALPVFAQTAEATLITQAIVTTKTSMIVPDDADATPPPSATGDGQRVMMFGPGMGGEDTKTTIWLKDEKVKIFSETDMGRNTVLIDKKNNRTTTLIEMMGMKRGFYSTAEDEAERKRQMDSLLNAAGKKPTSSTIEVEYIDSAKKISGFNCKKALIKTIHDLGKTDTVEVWYTPEMKMAEAFAFSGGMMGGSNSLRGLEKLNGFPIQYQLKMRRGIKMNVLVTKIDTKKEIADKEFDIPKDFDVKPMKDMMNGNGQMRFNMRMGDH